MADSKISALTPASFVAATNEFAINEAGVSKKVTGAQIATYLQTVGMTKVLALASNAAENETATLAKITGLDVTVGAGTYVFEYYIRAQTADVLNSMKFAVTHTGTLTAFMCDLYFPSAGVTAATGAVDQEAAAITTGSVWAHQSTRVKNTTLGPQTGIDTINVDVLYRISGMMIVTVSGDLQLWHASELTQANGTMVMAGSCLILIQVG